MVAYVNQAFKADQQCKNAIKICEMTVDLPPLKISIPKKGGKFKQGNIKSQTSVNISPDSHDIGLQLNTNTNVSVESKCSKYDLKSLFITILLFEVGFLHFYLHKLSHDHQATDQLLSDVESRIQFLVTVNDNLKESLRVLQSSYEQSFRRTPHLKHTVYKRDLTSRGHHLDMAMEKHVMNDAGSADEHAESRRPERSISGPLLAHFKGALPEALIQDGGIIAPWYLDSSAAKEHLLSNVGLQEGRGRIEILEKGLYFIYAQVYYLTTETLNSFSIHVEREGERNELVLATCSTVAANVNLSEVSCYTAVVRFLMPGDVIYLSQRERNRRIIFRNGQTFFGITMLNAGKTPG